MEEEVKRIDEWLLNLLGEQNMLRYDVNETTVTTLHVLMQRNKALDKTTQIAIEDLNQKTSEYKAEGERLQHILNQIGITSSKLSQDGLENLKSLVNLSVDLSVATPSHTSLLLALSELTERAHKTSADLNHERLATSDLKLKTSQRLEHLNVLKSLLQEANERAAKERPDLDKKINVTIKFLQAKRDDYENTIGQLQQRLESAGVEPSIYHATLLKKSEEYDSLKEKLEEVKGKVKSFHALPPDMSLAKVEIERVKKELASLEREIAQRIDLLHM